ncbi:hypothetical protein B0H17DRAFT_1153080 [Mycena rosella]|uniref:Uncharacterized protein n=1 Tax=Mycena rosella TaxID=1033263 RepID=A0AAD7B914_MYCRO|nr:hypothetical protein B0H17DRAFT_1153080 [Mycena rosella]
MYMITQEATEVLGGCGTTVEVLGFCFGDKFDTYSFHTTVLTALGSDPVLRSSASLRCSAGEVIADMNAWAAIGQDTAFVTSTGSSGGGWSSGTGWGESDGSGGWGSRPGWDSVAAGEGWGVEVEAAPGSVDETINNYSMMPDLARVDDEPPSSEIKSLNQELLEHAQNIEHACKHEHCRCMALLLYRVKIQQARGVAENARTEDIKCCWGLGKVRPRHEYEMLVKSDQAGNASAISISWPPEFLYNALRWDLREAVWQCDYKSIYLRQLHSSRLTHSLMSQRARVHGGAPHRGTGHGGGELHINRLNIGTTIEVSERRAITTSGMVDTVPPVDLHHAEDVDTAQAMDDPDFSYLLRDQGEWASEDPVGAWERVFECWENAVNTIDLMGWELMLTKRVKDFPMKVFMKKYRDETLNKMLRGGGKDGCGVLREMWPVQICQPTLSVPRDEKRSHIFGSASLLEDHGATSLFNWKKSPSLCIIARGYHRLYPIVFALLAGRWAVIGNITEAGVEFCATFSSALRVLFFRLVGIDERQGFPYEEPYCTGASSKPTVVPNARATGRQSLRRLVHPLLGRARYRGA